MTLEKVLRVAVLTGIFAIPFIVLIVTQSLFFPFITGKNFTFRVIVEIITVLWLALALVNPEYRPRRSWVLASIAFFVLMIGVSDIFGANPFKSFWSNYERMEGWVTLAHLLAFFVVATSSLNTEVLWRRFWHTSIGISILVGLYGIFQITGWIQINQGGVRLDATFGNAIYLGIYMLFHLFLTALMWEKVWRSSEHRWTFSFAYGSVMALQLFILFFTASRGAILGLLGGAFISALLLVVLASQSKNAWRASVGVVVGIIVLLGGFFLVRNAGWMQSIEPLRRLASISLSENTIASRFLNISMATKGIKENPILGWGQENYNLVFNKYYDPRMYAQEQWFDRTHNIVFDWLIAGGIVGFAAYVLIYLAALWALWGSGAFLVSERSIFTGLLAAYAFSIFFVFDNITSYIMFFMVLAYIAVRSGDALGANKLLSSWTLPRTWLTMLAVSAVVFGGVLVWAVNWKPFIANRTLIIALQPKKPEEGGLSKNLELFDKVIAYNTFGTQEAREHLAQGVMSFGGNSQIPVSEKRLLLDLVRKQLDAQIADAPDDARFPYFAGALSSVYGFSEEALPYLEKARTLSPKKQSILFQIGMSLFAVGKNEEATAVFKEAYEAAPEYKDARVFYASALIRTKQDVLADEILAPLLASGDSTDQRLIMAYLERQRYDKIAELWASRAKAFPGEPQARFALAASYYAGKNRRKAIETMEQAAKDIPAIASQAEQLIEQIRNGTVQLGQ